MKEPRQGNVRQISDPIDSDLQKFPDGRKIEITLPKNTNGERKPDEFTQRGLPGILEASNSSAP